MDKDVIKLINIKPNNFCILQADTGFFGSLVYRVVVGSSDNFIWSYDFSGCAEKLRPLEWPHLTEGYNIYTISDNRTYSWFKENHLATAHISHKLLEYSSKEDIIKFYNKEKILLLKTHDLTNHSYFSCKIVRVVGSVYKIFDPKETTFRTKRYNLIKPIYQNNIHNLIIDNLMSEDFDIFIDEYIQLCYFLDISPNINNVRQFILLMRDKLKRYELSLS
jgi:hypothetical protein